ncbi:hypothetical protein D3C77_444350 [compost metagenome]
MKKIWIGIATAAIVMGIRTAAYAANTNNDADSRFKFFEQMLPYARQMHPDFSDKQIEEMYNNCHGGNGPQRMMNNNSHMRGGMMGF